MLEHLTQLPAQDAQAIVQSFLDDVHTEKDPGMFAMFPDPESLSCYLNAYVRAGVRSGWMYRSGHVYVMLHRDEEYPDMTSMMILRLGLLRALGIRGSHAFLRLLRQGGISQEQQLRTSGRHFLQAELIAIPTAFQHQGCLRPAMTEIYAMADRLRLPLILSTDQELKMRKYRHLGMRLAQTRILSGDQRIYEMIRTQ